MSIARKEIFTIPKGNFSGIFHKERDTSGGRRPYAYGAVSGADSAAVSHSAGR